MQVGFIGLGVMGRPMASHLLKAGHSLYTCINQTPVHPDLLAAGIHVCATPAEVAAAAEILITMLPATEHVREVLLGSHGVIPAIDHGKIIIDMSSIDPAATRAFASQANQAGCEYLDAPVSGGQVGAENAALTIMVGGDPQTYQRVLPLFEAMGKNINLVGAVGSGQICKIANQIIVGLNIEAVAEALVFASKAGADPVKVREALMGGFAASRVLEVHGEKMIQRRFEPGRVDLHRKDLNLAMDAARTLNVALPNTSTALQLFNSCAAQEKGGNLDHSSLVLALETLANQRIDEASDG